MSLKRWKALQGNNGKVLLLRPSKSIEQSIGLIVLLVITEFTVFLKKKKKSIDVTYVWF